MNGPTRVGAVSAVVRDAVGAGRRRGALELPRRRRRALAVCLAGMLSVSLTVGGSGVAWASDRAFAECPVNEPNVGCGFDGIVGAGSNIVVYNFKLTSGGYDKEIKSSFCNRDTCTLTSVSVARSDRIPANFEITSDGVATVYNVYPVYP